MQSFIRQLELIGPPSGLLDVAIGPSGPHLANGPSGPKTIDSRIFGCAKNRFPNPSGIMSDRALASQSFSIVSLTSTCLSTPIWICGGSGPSGFWWDQAADTPPGKLVDRANLASGPIGPHECGQRKSHRDLFWIGPVIGPTRRSGPSGHRAHRAAGVSILVGASTVTCMTSQPCLASLNSYYVFNSKSLKSISGGQELIHH